MHGRRSRSTGGQVPPEFGAGGRYCKLSPQILSYRYKNERSVAFKIRQNPFSAGALPRTPMGELTTLPRPLSRLERGHPSPGPTLLGTDPPSALAMRPPRSPARSAPMLICTDSLVFYRGVRNVSAIIFIADCRSHTAASYVHHQ